jgi:hypothetical protein
MSFCGNCGGELDSDAKFCQDCGKPVVAPGATTVPGAQPQEVTPVVTASVFAQRPAVTATATHSDRAATRPAATLPVGDYLRDGIAALLLIASLFMVWKYGIGDYMSGSISAARIDVILITLVSLASLGIPYLWRAGVFGSDWNYVKTQDARILANMPYFVMVAVYLVISMVAGAGSDRPSAFVLGPAVAFGLAGAVLAAQPRDRELGPEDAGRDQRWIVASLLLAALIVITTLVQVIGLAVHAFAQDRAGDSLGGVLIVIIMGAASAVILTVVAVGVARALNSWRLVGIGLGVSAVVFALLSLIPQITLVHAEFDGGLPAFSFMFWIAFGAVVAAPSLARVTKPAMSGAAPWRAAARTVLSVAIGLNVLVAVVSVIALVNSLLFTVDYTTSSSPIPWVVALFFSVVGIVGGIVVRATLAKDSRQGYVLATGFAALEFVLGLVLVIMWSLQSLGGISSVTMLIAFALPVGLAVLLWGPASARSHFAMLPSDRGLPAQFSFDGSAPREQNTSVGPTHPLSAPGQKRDGVDIGSVIEEAANPATSSLRLREIASTLPEARAAVASNPAAYPDLLSWLGKLGDPEVDVALGRRSR